MNKVVVLDSLESTDSSRILTGFQMDCLYFSWMHYAFYELLKENCILQ